MNRLTLTIKNKTDYRIPRKIKGELREKLEIIVLNDSEYKKTYGEEFDKEAILVLANIEKSVASVIEQYLAKTMEVRCIANNEVVPDRKEQVTVYLKKGLSVQAVDAIVAALFEISLFIVNSNGFYLDSIRYHSCKGDSPAGEPGKGSVLHILRQPLDAVVLPQTINDDLSEDEKDIMSVGRNSKVFIVNLNNFKIAECTAFVEEEKQKGDVTEYGVYKEDGTWCKKAASVKMERDEISVSPYVARKLWSEQDHSLDNLLVLRVAGIKIDKVGVVNIDKILENTVQVSGTIMEVIKKEFPDNMDYSLVHEQTGAKMTVPNASLEAKTTPGKSTICLNYYQRVLLQLQPSSSVMQSILHTSFYRNMWNGEDVDGQIDSILKKSGGDEYLKQDGLKKLLVKQGYEKIKLYPEFETFGHKRSELNWIQQKWVGYAGRTVGTKNILLRCARPYNVDEVSRVVRMAPDKITILGIEPNDEVILRYKDRKCNARVLPYDVDKEWKEIQMTNLVGGEDDKSEIEVMVGIPAAIRDELGIPDVNVSVTVERDVKYVFHKNSNVQFLPIVALIFSVFDLSHTFFEGIPIGFQLLIALGVTIILAPLVFYIMLSGERSKVKAK